MGLGRNSCSARPPSVHPSEHRIAVFNYMPFGGFQTARIQILDAETGTQAAKQATIGADKFEWMPDGKRIVAIGESIRILDSKTLRGRFVRTRGHAHVTSVKVSPNQRWVATEDNDGYLQLWDRTRLNPSFSPIPLSRNQSRCSHSSGMGNKSPRLARIVRVSLRMCNWKMRPGHCGH